MTVDRSMSIQRFSAPGVATHTRGKAPVAHAIASGHNARPLSPPLARAAWARCIGPGTPSRSNRSIKGTGDYFYSLRPL